MLKMKKNKYSEEEEITEKKSKILVHGGSAHERDAALDIATQ
jgi:hypothetical protein